MKLILKDSTEVEIIEFTSSSFIAECEDFLETVNLYNTIASNLSDIKVMNGELIVYAATNLEIDGVQIMKTQTGYTAIYYYHGAKATESDEYATIGRILMGEE